MCGGEKEQDFFLCYKVEGNQHNNKVIVGGGLVVKKKNVR